MSKSGLRIATWVGAAVLATTAATLAIGFSLGARPDVLSADDVARNLSAQTPVAGSSTPASPGADDAGNGQGGGPSMMLTGSGGSVVVGCADGNATLDSWTPNPGFRADDPVRGPAAQVSVRFESDSSGEFTVSATCVNGVPTLATVADDRGGQNGGGVPATTEPGDDNGGQNHGGGGGKGSSGSDD
jgi:hypothetical protein